MSASSSCIVWLVVASLYLLMLFVEIVLMLFIVTVQMLHMLKLQIFVMILHTLMILEMLHLMLAWPIVRGRLSLLLREKGGGEGGLHFCIGLVTSMRDDNDDQL